MTRSRSKMSGLVCVAAVLIMAALAACGVGDNSSATGATPGDTAASSAPSTEAPPATSALTGEVRLTLYPEMGYIEGTTRQGDELTCNPDTVIAPLQLGGTVTLHGTPISTSEGGERVQFNANGLFQAYALVINDSKGVSIPREVNTAASTNIILKAEDWGPLNSVTVCAGGMRAITRQS